MKVWEVEGGLGGREGKWVGGVRGERGGWVCGEGMGKLGEMVCFLTYAFWAGEGRRR